MEKPPFDMPSPPPMMDTSHIKRKWLDIAYSEQSSAQKMDIYLPDVGEGPFPVIFVVHGGAWMLGDKGDVQNLPMLSGLRRGYAVVSINYRLSHEAIFPAQIFDCKAALRFIKANTSKYLLNKEKIAAWGGSAGGHLAALLGTSVGISDLEGLTMGNPDQKAEVQAVIDWYGPTEDFLRMDEELIESGNGIADHSLPDSPESKLLGQVITKIPERVRFASPMTYANKDIPYFFIQHGYFDQLVPYQQSLHFAAALEKAAGKDKVHLEIFQPPLKVFHADPYFETNENVNRVLGFLDQYLK
jgi:acetyl esterase/lipase